MQVPPFRENPRTIHVFAITIFTGLGLGLRSNLACSEKSKNIEQFNALWVFHSLWLLDVGIRVLKSRSLHHWTSVVCLKHKFRVTSRIHHERYQPSTLQHSSDSFNNLEHWKKIYNQQKERVQVAHLSIHSKEVPVNHPCVYNRRVVSSAQPSPT